MKKAWIVLIALFLGCGTRTKLHDYPISALDVKNVELIDGFWLPIIKTVQEKTIQYAFDKCSTEGRMDNFLIAGGELEGKTCGKMPFDDTDLYKIIEGASYSLISAPDPKLKAYIDSVIAIIKVGQEVDGYLTTWRTIDPHHPPAKWVNPGERWEHLGASHELYNSGHMFEAAAANYYATGDTVFLNIALKNADLLTEVFGPDKLQATPGHQIVETGLIKLYRISKDEKYLELAKYFLDQRGDSLSHDLYGAYSQDHLPVTEQDEVVGHAVRAVYMYAGMTDIAAIYGDSEYLKAVNALWENMVGKKMYLTGGIGARHSGESFGDNYELPNLTAYNETCAAIGSIYWNQRLFQLTGNAKYIDVIERTLYNGMLAGLSLDGTHFFYPNPLEADGEYKFNQGSRTRQGWFDCSCCPTNIIRFVPSIPNLIYAVNEDSLYINLYVGSNARFNINHTDMRLEQTSGFPWNGNAEIKLDLEKETRMTLKLRIPGWVLDRTLPGNLYSYSSNSAMEFSILINGEPADYKYNKGFAEITRTWKKGDHIELEFSMTIKRIIADTRVAEDHGKTAIDYGPIVYCAEEIDNPNFMELLINGGTQFDIEHRDNLLNGVNVISAKNPDMMLIPYYAWSNRGEGKMKVWFGK